VLGGLASETDFEPKAAIFLQNKDQLKIPLTLESIPAPKAFKKAIESISPEMQRFANAYRSLQQSNTIFGILGIGTTSQPPRVEFRRCYHQNWLPFCPPVFHPLLSCFCAAKTNFPFSFGQSNGPFRYQATNRNYFKPSSR
jgi:hypothetical protein